MVHKPEGHKVHSKHPLYSSEQTGFLLRRTLYVWYVYIHAVYPNRPTLRLTSWWRVGGSETVCSCIDIRKCAGKTHAVLDCVTKVRINTTYLSFSCLQHVHRLLRSKLCSCLFFLYKNAITGNYVAVLHSQSPENDSSTSLEYDVEMLCKTKNLPPH